MLSLHSKQTDLSTQDMEAGPLMALGTDRPHGAFGKVAAPSLSPPKQSSPPHPLVED